MLKYFLASESDTLNLGKQLALASKEPCLIFLEGDLGAGKTTLVRGFLQGLGYTGSVKSPTYTIVESYEINQTTVFHFDLYRLTDPEELAYMGIRDYFSQPAIVLVEWPERGANQLPAADLTCYIVPLTTGRQLQISASSERGHKILQQLSAQMHQYENKP